MIKERSAVFWVETAEKGGELIEVKEMKTYDNDGVMLLSVFEVKIQTLLSVPGFRDIQLTDLGKEVVQDLDSSQHVLRLERNYTMILTFICS